MADSDAVVQKVYEECLQAPQNHLFSNDDLQDMVPGRDLQKTLMVINSLLQRGLLKTLKQGEATVFRVVKKEEADK